MQSKGLSETGSGAHGRLCAAGLLQRLLQCVGQSAPGPEALDHGESAFDGLPPPGRRSGKGTASLTPYLDQFRNTRPASLE